MLAVPNRLKKQKDFEAAFKNGRGFKDGFLFLKVAENGLTISRFGFSVGLKVSKKATIRNKARRRLREAIRLVISRIKTGFDVVVVPSPEVQDKNFKAIQDALLKVLRKAGLLNR